MKTLLLLILLCGTAYADPVMVGGGTATFPTLFGVYNWNTSGMQVNFTVTNTSAESLIITQLSNDITGLWTAANLAIEIGDSQSFTRQLNGAWVVSWSEFLDRTTVYFTPTTAVPEPATLGLLGAGLAALWKRRRSTGT